MKTLIILIAFFLSSILNAQTYKLYQTENIHNQLKLNTKTGEVYQIQNDGQRFLVNFTLTYENDISGKYALYETENMWTYILLDTFNGKLWQCQYSVEGSQNRFCLEINPNELATSEKSKFTIQPMTSMFQFYLLNEDSGDMWKFQWSTKGDEYRWIEKL